MLIRTILLTVATALLFTACENPHTCNYDSTSNTLVCAEKTYATANVDGKIWMVENLNYYDPDSSFCYGNDNGNCKKYGRLYDYASASTSCPKGLRLPTESEYLAFIGNKAVTEIDNFKMLKAGFRYYDNKFADENVSASFWTRDSYDDSRATLVRISDSVRYERFNKKIGASVRCVMD